jgi:hypothetical protein
MWGVVEARNLCCVGHGYLKNQGSTCYWFFRCFFNAIVG